MGRQHGGAPGDGLLPGYVFIWLSWSVRLGGWGRGQGTEHEQAGGLVWLGRTVFAEQRTRGYTLTRVRLRRPGVSIPSASKGKF